MRAGGWAVVAGNEAEQRAAGKAACKGSAFVLQARPSTCRSRRSPLTCGSITARLTVSVPVKPLSPYLRAMAPPTRPSAERSTLTISYSLVAELALEMQACNRSH